MICAIETIILLLRNHLTLPHRNVDSGDFMHKHAILQCIALSILAITSKAHPSLHTISHLLMQVFRIAKTSDNTVPETADGTSLLLATWLTIRLAAVVSALTDIYLLEVLRVGLSWLNLLRFLL